MLWQKAIGARAAAENVVTDNLLLYLDAADPSSYSGTGTTWTDLGSEGRDGTLTNGPVWNSTYFDFDGNNDYVELGTIPVNDPLQLNSPSGNGMSLMFALWIDTGGDGYQRIIAKSDGGLAANGYDVYTSNPSDNDRILFASDGNGAFAGSTSDLVPNTWAILTFTWNSSTGDWEWYVDGVSDNTGNRTYDIPNAETGMHLATWYSASGRELDGRIGFMMVYDKVLSSSEVTQNFNALKNNYGL